MTKCSTRKGKGKGKCDYGSLENSDKQLKKESGLFLFPEAIEGKTDHGLRKFLVFYFDDDKDYQIVLDAFRKPVTKTRSHPDLDSRKLAEFTRLGKESLGL